MGSITHLVILAPAHEGLQASAGRWISQSCWHWVPEALRPWWDCRVAVVLFIGLCVFIGREKSWKLPVVTRGRFPGLSPVLPLAGECGSSFPALWFDLLPIQPPAPVLWFQDSPDVLTRGRSRAEVANLPRLLNTNPHCPWQGKSLPVIHLASEKGDIFFFAKSSWVVWNQYDV